MTTPIDTALDALRLDGQSTFDEILAELRKQYLSVDSSLKAEKSRYEQFIRTIMVNALRQPDRITIDQVAFLCEAALKGFTLSQAIHQLEINGHRK